MRVRMGYAGPQPMWTVFPAPMIGTVWHSKKVALDTWLSASRILQIHSTISRRPDQGGAAERDRELVRGVRAQEGQVQVQLCHPPPPLQELMLSDTQDVRWRHLPTDISLTFDHKTYFRSHYLSVSTFLAILIFSFLSLLSIHPRALPRTIPSSLDSVSISSLLCGLHLPHLVPRLTLNGDPSSLSIKD